MKKKLKTALIVLAVLILLAVACYIAPKTFAKNLAPSAVDHINVFDGSTGTGFTITDPEAIRCIVENIQSTPMKRAGISLGRMGYGLKLSLFDSQDKDLVPLFIINGDHTIRKDPFFYTCPGGLCYDYIKALEPDLSAEASADGFVFHGTILAIADGSLLVEPLEGSRELSSSSQFAIPIAHMNSAPEPEVGDRIEVYYNGETLETYPAGLGGITYISVVKTASGAFEIADEAFAPDSPKICINNVTYVFTGREIPVEPDESAIEYVEIPVGGENAGMITAFALLEEGKMIVCLLNGEWCEFVAMG